MMNMAAIRGGMRPGFNPAMGGMAPNPMAAGAMPGAGMGPGGIGMAGAVSSLGAGGINPAVIPMLGVGDLLSLVDNLVKQTKAEVGQMAATGQLQPADPMGGAGGGAGGGDLASLLGGAGGAGGGLDLQA